MKRKGVCMCEQGQDGGEASRGLDTRLSMTARRGLVVAGRMSAGRGLAWGLNGGVQTHTHHRPGPGEQRRGAAGDDDERVGVRASQVSQERQGSGAVRGGETLEPVWKRMMGG